MKKIVSVVLALVLVAAFGVTSMAYGYWTKGDDSHYVVVYGELADERDLPSDNFVVAPVVTETAVEPNPGTGLHFGF